MKNFAEKMIANVQVVVNAYLDDLTNVMGIFFDGEKTVERVPVKLTEAPDGTGVYTAENLQPQHLSHYHYVRLYGEEFRAGEGTDNPWCKAYCQPDGEKLRPFLSKGTEKAMFVSKRLVAIYANFAGSVNIALEWVDERNLVHHKPLLVGGKTLTCKAFFTAGVGTKLEKAIGEWLKRNIVANAIPSTISVVGYAPEKLAPVVAHALLKANGYRGIYADLSGRPKYKSAQKVEPQAPSSALDHKASELVQVEQSAAEPPAEPPLVESPAETMADAGTAIAEPPAQTAEQVAATAETVADAGTVTAEPPAQAAEATATVDTMDVAVEAVEETKATGGNGHHRGKKVKQPVAA